MFDDNDIKIFGEKKLTEKEIVANLPKEKIEKAKQIGKSVAEIFIGDYRSQLADQSANTEFLTQRILLLSFTATAGFEEYIGDDILIGFAQKSFLDTVKHESGDLYKASSDMGAFSFYYLAFRRDNEIERRIGQTFAMLCSHDGDPIFQELGEALFCWFSAKVKAIVEEHLDII
ncbi:MAG: hypothetical protein J5766_01900 [Clostridia bacterium]|nr:hypothetical protein [Clostridia bacterium]